MPHDVGGMWMSSTLVMSDSIVFITISTFWCWCVQRCDIQADPNISKLGVGYRPLCLLGFLEYVFFQIIIIFTYLSIISSSMMTKDGQRSDLQWPMRCATLSGVFLYFILFYFIFLIPIYSPLWRTICKKLEYGV